MSFYLRIVKATYRITLILWLGSQVSCAKKQALTMTLPETLPEPTKNRMRFAKKSPSVTPLAHKESQKKEIAHPVHIKRLNPLYLTKTKQAKKALLPSFDFDLPQDKISLNAHGLPLKNFIHLALNEVLHIPFEMDDAISKRTDPVNLHINKPIPAKDLLEIVEQLLNSFDVSLIRIKHGLRAVPKSALKDYPPMPPGQLNNVTSGQVVEIIPLTYVAMGELSQIATSIFQLGKYGSINYNKRLNAVTVVGEVGRVKRFKQFVSFLEHPAFEQHQLRLIRPIYWSSDELAKQLLNLLKIQGIPTSDSAENSQSVVVLTIKAMNALLVTSPNKMWMQQAENLISQLDDASAAGPTRQTFIYFTQHRPANELGELIIQAAGGGATTPAESGSKQNKTRGKTQNSASKKSPKSTQQNPTESQTTQYSTPDLNIVVDTKRSALIFVGTASAYKMVVPILKALDIPARQVLIEITVADVTLNNQTKLGVEWAIDRFNVAGALADGIAKGAGGLGGLGGLSMVQGSLTYEFVDKAGGIRALLNALSINGQAKILSSPTLLAMDGETAHIQVGNQVSVVTSEVSNSSSSTAGGAGLLRAFNYIDTGVILDISPTITEYGSIQMDVQQEVSDIGEIVNGQPLISTRKVNTVIVANSGQTVLIGGLIKHSQNETKNQVPFLGDIPYLGSLFRNTDNKETSTELIMLITPHIIKDQIDADALTQSYRRRLGW